MKGVEVEVIWGLSPAGRTPYLPVGFSIVRLHVCRYPQTKAGDAHSAEQLLLQVDCQSWWCHRRVMWPSPLAAHPRRHGSNQSDQIKSSRGGFGAWG